MATLKPKKFILGLAVGLVLLGAVGGGALADRLFGLKPLDLILPRGASTFSHGFYSNPKKAHS